MLLGDRPIPLCHPHFWTRERQSGIPFRAQKAIIDRIIALA
jgi:hypothetical protein